MKLLGNLAMLVYGIGPGSTKKVTAGFVLKRVMTVNLIFLTLVIGLIFSLSLHTHPAPVVDETTLEARVMKKVEERLEEIGKPPAEVATPEPEKVMIEKVIEKVVDQETIVRSQKNENETGALWQELARFKDETKDRFDHPEHGVFKRLSDSNEQVFGVFSRTLRNQRRIETLKAYADGSAIVRSADTENWPEDLVINPMLKPNSLNKVKPNTEVKIEYGESSYEFTLNPGDQLEVWLLSPDFWGVSIYRLETVLESREDILKPDLEFLEDSVGK